MYLLQIAIIINVSAYFFMRPGKGGTNEYRAEEVSYGFKTEKRRGMQI